MSFSLHHLVREPKEKREKNPLLLLLHGYGSNEEDLFSFASELPGEYYVISARAPYSLPPYGYAWYAIDFDADENKFSDVGQAKISRDLVMKFIDELIENYPIDEDNITLIGFSQGCILSYAAALSNPEKIRRVAAMSGYLNKELLADGYERNDFSNLKFFISHGTSDQVVPVEWARKAKPELDALGITNEYHEYPVGHGVAPQNFFDVLNWLKK
ncbi:MAG: phospholipase [Flavobacterium sp.]|nr:MAG: phospholipase [Flavobacterium sp.]